MDRNKLLILDINGLLCHKVNKPCDGEESDSEDINKNYLDRKFYKVYSRPGVDKFLIWCLENHDVAIWSSTTNYNAEPILKWLFPKHEMLSRLKFDWYRNNTNLDPDFGLDSRVENYDTVKNLKNVWSHPYINESRKYSKTNTIIIDDSVRKTRFNNSDNVLIVDKYSPLNWSESDEDICWVEDIQNKIIEKFEIIDLKHAL